MNSVNYDQMVADLTPVRPLRPAHALMLPVGVAAFIATAIGMLFGPRADLLVLDPHPMFLIRAGVLLLLGLVTGLAAARMASPAVSRAGSSWLWVLAVAGLFPLGALVALAGGNTAMAALFIPSALQCLTMSIVGGAAVAVPMVLWLRRGAPTSPTRASWLTGVAAGSMGAFAYGFHCPYNDIAYIGVWYTLSVAAVALLARLVIPHLIRW